jgi:hypothetical protein
LAAATHSADRTLSPKLYEGRGVCRRHHRENETVSDSHLDYLSPKAIYLLASGKYSGEIIEQVLTAAAAGQPHIGAADVRRIAKAGSKAAILQGIEADQQAGDEVARLLSLAKTNSFETVDTWETAREADRVKREAAWEAEQAEIERQRTEAILDHTDTGKRQS